MRKVNAPTHPHLDELRRNDEDDARAALYPHPGSGLVVLGRPRLCLAAAEERGERVEVADVVAGPILELRVEHLELEREDAVEEVRARLARLQSVQDREEVRAFGGGLVEEAHAREGGETEVP